jgi:quaternary ammonium compound-resistance protein SugE
MGTGCPSRIINVWFAATVREGSEHVGPTGGNRASMSWYLLVVAGLFEVAWAVGLEYSEGLTRPVPTAGTAVVSVVLLAKAVETLPVGTAYAVWTGIGAVGTAALGVVLFDEPVDLPRVFFLSLVVVGITGLHVSSTGT